MRTPAFEAFVAPARAFPQIWRLIVGLLLALATYVIVMMMVLLLGIPILGIDLSALMTTEGEVRPDVSQQFGTILFGESPTSMMVLLATFIGMLLGPIVAVSVMHKRRPDSLFGPRAVTIRTFLVAAAITAAIIAVVFMIPIGPEPQPNLDPHLWLTFLPMALVGVAIQTGAEEVLFRGYILQQLAARFRSPIIWAGVPTILFGLAHYAPDQNGDNTWIYVLATGVFGLAAADLTARTGSIGAAWGLHFANNCAALLLVSVDGPLSGLGLYVLPIDPTDTETLRPLMALDVIVTIVIWAAIRFALTRRGPRAA